MSIVKDPEPEKTQEFLDWFFSDSDEWYWEEPYNPEKDGSVEEWMTKLERLDKYNLSLPSEVIEELDYMSYNTNSDYNTICNVMCWNSSSM